MVGTMHAHLLGCSAGAALADCLAQLASGAELSRKPPVSQGSEEPVSASVLCQGSGSSSLHTRRAEVVCPSVAQHTILDSRVHLEEAACPCWLALL